MLAHCFTIRSGQLGPKGAYALVQLLDLGFSQNGARRLMLQPIDKSRKEVDVLCLHRCEFIVVFGHYKCRGR